MEDVVAGDVAHLVPEHRLQLVAIQHIDGAAVDEDERLVHPQRACVGEGRLRDVELRFPAQIEDVEYPLMEIVDPAVLLGGHPDGVGLEEEPKTSLAEEADDFSDEFGEARYGIEAAQGRPVRRVLPGAGGDVRQFDSRGWRQSARFLVHAGNLAW